MTYKLSRRSLARLEGVHPDLVTLAHKAIEDTDIDFTVLEGMRTVARQRQLVKTGASKTMKSRHLTGHAVDLAPFVDGEVSWHWPHYFVLMKAVRKAAIELGVSVRWGGVWDRRLEKLSTDLDAEVKAYCKRHPGPDFIDGPHIEL